MKNILITGASSGLGAALAEHYAQHKNRLFLGGRDAERLEIIAQRCRELGAEVHTQICDTTAANIMHQWIVGVDKRFPLDIVYANAGISGGTVGLDAVNISLQAHRIFDVNVMGVLNTIGPALSRMADRRHGQVVLISSLASYAPFSGAPAYSASKAAIRYYGTALRSQFAKYNVGVTVVCPGFIKTPMTDVNPFAMPLLMHADKAAYIIANAVAKNKGLIAFPWPVSMASQILGLLPSYIRDLCVRYLPEKTPLKNP